ncbi:MAG: UvrD-helicase domain-containing protein, partial [Bacillota bacterium]|nr:UvrD-helicase domain-containing protein [Bacillota bacterium]
KLGDDSKFMKTELKELLELSEADFRKDPHQAVSLANIKNRSNSEIPIRLYDFKDAEQFKRMISFAQKDVELLVQAAAANLTLPGYGEEIDFICRHKGVPFWQKMNSTWKSASFKPLRDAAARIVYTHCMEAMLPLVEEYRQWKLENSIATFNDLLLRARDLLRDSKEARDYFHERYQVLYVDEFQDTDPVQAELLFYLTSDPAAVDTKDWRNCRPVPGSLFLVGDPKQAIYRFRGADIDVYNQVKSTFLGGIGQIRQLSHNFRSAKAVCEMTTTLFDPPSGLTDEKIAKKYFSPKTGPLQNPKQAKFTEMIAEQGEIDGSYLFSYEAINKEETDPLQVAAFIRTMVDEKVGVPRKINGKMGLAPAQWSDFLVLTGKRKEIKYYVDAFSEMDIPVNVTGDQTLNEVETIRRMVLHLKILLEEQNDLALIRLLTECYDASISDLRMLMHRAGWSRLQKGLWQKNALLVRMALEKEIQPDKELIRLCDRLTELGKWKNDARKLPAMSVIERLADDCCSIWAEEMELPQRRREYGRVQQYLDLIRGGTQHSFPALAVYAVACAERAVSHELSLEKEENQVQIMNLHKAKGLEGNIVILTNASLGGKPSSHVERDPHAKWYGTINSKNRILAWPKDWNGEELNLKAKKGGSVRISKKKAEKEYLEAERVRLLYVAVTRAAYWLVVCGKKDGTDTGAWKNIAGNAKFPDVKAIEKDSKDPAMRKALTALRTGAVQYQKKMQQRGVHEVSVKGLDEKREGLIAACADTSFFGITPSRLDAASRSVKRRQDRAEDDTAAQSAQQDDAAAQSVQKNRISAPATKEPHGADWGTIMHRIMELAVREQAYDEESIADFARQAVSETLSAEILSKTQKQQLLAGNDIEAEKVNAWVAEKAAQAAAFLSDTASPLRKLIADASCYPELPFMMRAEDKNSPIYQHLAAHISDEKAQGKILDVEGIIDLAVYTKDGNWIVVDYKTDKFRRGETAEGLQERLREEYTPQILSYAKILESLGRGKVCAAYLCSIPMKGALIPLALDGGVAVVQKDTANKDAIVQDAVQKKGGYAVNALKKGRSYSAEVNSCEGMNRFSLLLDGVPV